MLSFENQENIENIFKIERILKICIRIELLRKTSNLIQNRCQAFNHQ